MKKSFTLIEMLIVIVIIGILAAALIPRIQSIQERARATKLLKLSYDVDVSMKIKELDSGVLPTGIWDLLGDFRDRGGNDNNLAIGDGPGNPIFVNDQNLNNDQVLIGTGGATTRASVSLSKSYPNDKVCISGLFNLGDTVTSTNHLRSNRFILYSLANTLTLRVWNNGGATTYQQTTVPMSTLGISQGKWHHIAIEFNGSGTNFWVDGAHKYFSGYFQNPSVPDITNGGFSVLQYNSVATKVSRLRIWPYPCYSDALSY